MGAKPLLPSPENRRGGRILGVLVNLGSWVHMELRGSCPNAEPFGRLGSMAIARNTVQGWRPPAVLESVAPLSRAQLACLGMK